MGTRTRVGIFATLLFLILSASTDLRAQGRGGGARGGGMSHGMGGGRVAQSGTFAGRPGTQFAGRPVAPFVTSPVGPAVPPVVTPPNANIPRVGGGPHHGFDRSFVGSRRNAFATQPFFGGGFGGFVPTYYYDPFSAYGAQPYVEPQYAAPPESNNNSELSYQVQQLSQQIEDLRAQEEAMAAARLQPPPPLPPSTPEPPPPPTTLLFRDGHRMSIQNYAVVGDMLLVLDNRNSIKIPLADLDLDATKKINRGNGVRFSLGR